MLIFTSPAEVPSGFGPSAVTIGKFDGVHTGHRAVIKRLRAEAHARGLASVVVTFDRNPLSVLAPEKCPPALLSNAQKLELIAGTGADALLMLTFDENLAALSPEGFSTTILADALHAKAVLVGTDFRFGAQGSGDVERLRSDGRALGFEVVVVEDVAPDGQRRASSTWIRELLSQGRIVEAADLLGGLPSVRAVVVPGQQRGRTLGYPTANLSRDVEGFVPADGVYAAWLTVDGNRYPAAVSIGNNPTFEGVPDQQIEAHVLDESLDLYGRRVEVSFVEYIRGMRKFPDTAALASQMMIDELWIRDLLGVNKRV